MGGRMKLKKDADIEDLQSTIDNEGFWYALTNFLEPEEFLSDKNDIRKVESAIRILKELEDLIPPL